MKKYLEPADGSLGGNIERAPQPKPMPETAEQPADAGVIIERSLGQIKAEKEALERQIKKLSKLVESSSDAEVLENLQNRADKLATEYSKKIADLNDEGNETTEVETPLKKRLAAWRAKLKPVTAFFVEKGQFQHYFDEVAGKKSTQTEVAPARAEENLADEEETERHATPPPMPADALDEDEEITEPGVMSDEEITETGVKFEAEKTKPAVPEETTGVKREENLDAVFDQAKNFGELIDQVKNSPPLPSSDAEKEAFEKVCNVIDLADAKKVIAELPKKLPVPLLEKAKLVVALSEIYGATPVQNKKVLEARLFRHLPNDAWQKKARELVENLLHDLDQPLPPHTKTEGEEVGKKIEATARAHGQEGAFLTSKEQDAEREEEKSYAQELLDKVKIVKSGEVVPLAQIIDANKIKELRRQNKEYNYLVADRLLALDLSSPTFKRLNDIANRAEAAQTAKLHIELVGEQKNSSESPDQSLANEDQTLAQEEERQLRKVLEQRALGLDITPYEKSIAEALRAYDDYVTAFDPEAALPARSSLEYSAQLSDDQKKIARDLLMSYQRHCTEQESKKMSKLNLAKFVADNPAFKATKPEDQKAVNNLRAFFDLGEEPVAKAARSSAEKRRAA